MTQFNPTVPVYGVLGPSVVGMRIAYATATTLTVTSGSATDSNGNNVITVSTASTTIDGATNGLNGLDTGSLAASTLYYVFAIGDPSGFNASGFLLSTSRTAPLLPSGRNGNNYGIFARLGAVFTDGSSHFRIAYQEPNVGKRRYMQYDTPIAVLTGGTATTDTAISLATAIPPTAGNVIIRAALTPNAASDTASIKTYGGTGYDIIQVGQVAAVVSRLQYEILPSLNSSNLSLTYKLSTASAALTVEVVGYFDLL